jgi:hypothetical protein
MATTLPCIERATVRVLLGSTAGLGNRRRVSIVVVDFFGR